MEKSVEKIIRAMKENPKITVKNSPHLLGYREEVWRKISKYSKKRDYSVVLGQIKVAIGK